MQENTERWKELCEQAAVEQDPQRLLELTREINDSLLGKQRRLESTGLWKSGPIEVSDISVIARKRAKDITFCPDFRDFLRD
jgi:hypothetical protein